jgi:hypothetical protein
LIGQPFSFSRQLKWRENPQLWSRRVEFVAQFAAP